MDPLEQQLGRANARPSDRLDQRIESLARKSADRRHAAPTRRPTNHLRTILLAASIILLCGLVVAFISRRTTSTRPPIDVRSPHPTAAAATGQLAIAHAPHDLFDFSTRPTGPFGRIDPAAVRTHTTYGAPQ